jgi:hypothetical protein
VNNPEFEIVPALAQYVTWGELLLPSLHWPFTPNCCCPLGGNDTDDGFSDIDTKVAEAPGPPVLNRIVDESALPQLHDAITMKLPAIGPAAKSPFTDTVPPVARYVTATGRTTPSDHIALALNCCDPPTDSSTEAGDKLTFVTVGDKTLTWAVSARVPPWCRAMIWKTPAVLPATNRPLEYIVPPPDAVHVTVGLVVDPLFHVAASWSSTVMPFCTLTLSGTIRRLVKATADEVTVTAAVSAKPAPPTWVAMTRKVPAVPPAV